MKRVLPYVTTAFIAMLACDQAPPENRVAVPVPAVIPDAAVADTAQSTPAVADTAQSTPAEPPGRGFRMRGEQVVADTFQLRHELRGGRLTIYLRTDLGDDTEVFVSIARVYRVKGSAEDYIIEYYNAAGPVAPWRSGKTIDLTSTDFWGEVGKLRRAMALQGDPFDVDFVSDELKIDFNVYPGQAAPFAKGNANLVGRAVSMRGDIRVIEKDLVVRYPLRETDPG